MSENITELLKQLPVSDIIKNFESIDSIINGTIIEKIRIILKFYIQLGDMYSDYKIYKWKYKINSVIIDVSEYTGGGEYNSDKVIKIPIHLFDMNQDELVNYFEIEKQNRKERFEKFKIMREEIEIKRQKKEKEIAEKRERTLYQKLKKKYGG